MIRTLFIIAGAALVLCIVTAGGAVAIGGQFHQPRLARGNQGNL